MASRQRTSAEQFATLIEFMERNGDIARPQQGPQGRIRADRSWEELSTILNSVGGGVHKSTEKWKKVWADWKTKTKGKALQIRRHMRATGGGPNCRLSLTDLEERVLGLIGLAAVEGQAGIEEQGFGSQQQYALSQSALSQSAPSQSVPSRPSTGPSTSTSQQSMEVNATPSSATLPNPLSEPSSPAFGPIVLPPTTEAASAPDVGTSALRPPPPPPRPPPAAVSPPSSTTSSPRGRPLIGRRRRLRITPFERACDEYAAIEQRRLQREDARERSLIEREIERSRLEAERESERMQVEAERVRVDAERVRVEAERVRMEAERETERLRLEAQRIDVQREHNRLLNRLADITQALLEVLNRRAHT